VQPTRFCVGCASIARHSTTERRVVWRVRLAARLVYFVATQFAFVAGNLNERIVVCYATPVLQSTSERRVAWRVRLAARFSKFYQKRTQGSGFVAAPLFWV
jgi:hypothetical protein